MKTYKAKTRSISTNFAKQKSRDDSMWTQTDAYSNVILENTRENREIEIQARKE